jgi:glycosyltransferase involved in cell wall biosynthesis
MELSVILTCRNGAETIGTQLEALAGQEWSGSWEVVLVDNGSTDNSREIIDRFHGRVPGLRVVDAAEKAGHGYARNVGVRAAAGENLAFCDDDDEVAPGWVAAMGDALREAELVAGRLEHDRLNEAWAIAVRGRPQTDGLPVRTFVPYFPFAFACTIGIARRLHDSVGGFDEDMVPSAEDTDYCWRLQLAGAQIRFTPSAVTHYRARASLGDVFRQAQSYGLGDVRVYKKHRRLGMPPAPHRLASGVRKWLGLVKLFALAWNRTRLAIAMWHLGLRIGRLRGSIDQRILFP